MKRPVVSIAVTLLMSLAVGCDSSREVGPPPGPVQSPITNDFRKAMEGAGNKMMKGQMGKRSGDPVTKTPETPKDASPK